MKKYLLLIISVILVFTLDSCAMARIKIQEISSTREESSTQNSKVVNALDFTGEWNRTNVYLAYNAVITIKNQTAASFDFEFEGWNSCNSGGIEGIASIIDDNLAVFETESEFIDGDYVKVVFELIDGIIQVSILNGNESALGFGSGVFIRGEYTKEQPHYTNENIVNEIFISEELKNKAKVLLGDEIFGYVTGVMEYGLPSDTDMTFSGFLRGCGMGVHLLITDDYLYFLCYGIDSDGYTLYTNDAQYESSLPESIDIYRQTYDLKYVYRNI